MQSKTRTDCLAFLVSRARSTKNTYRNSCATQKVSQITSQPRIQTQIPSKKEHVASILIDVDNEAEVQTHAKQPSIEGIDDLLEHPRSGSEVINYYSSLFNHRQL